LKTKKSEITLFKEKKPVTEKKSNKHHGLIYALREILLVMAGILLALQVNNWNENRKQNIVEKTILNEILNAIRTDTIDLNINIYALNTANQSNDIIRNHMENDLPYNDTLKIHYGLSVSIVNFFSNTSAYQSLQSIGMDLISSDSLRKSIIEYYDLHNVILTTTEKEFINPYYHQNIMPFMLEHFDYSLFNPSKPNSYPKLKKNQKYFSILKTTFSLYELQIYRTQKTLDHGERLMQMIKQELESRK
jgi:hypothetical protein